jgi:hypothetical protein
MTPKGFCKNAGKNDSSTSMSSRQQNTSSHTVSHKSTSLRSKIIMASRDINSKYSMLSRYQGSPMIRSSKSAARKRPPLKKMSKMDRSISSKSTAATEVERHVSFSSEVSFQKTLSRDDYTVAEREATWYATAEYERMKRRNIKQIKKLNEGVLLNEMKYCARGLEGRTTTGSLCLAQTRASASNAVLKEQLDQRKQGILDVYAIADAYYRESSFCQMDAIVRGVYGSNPYVM